MENLTCREIILNHLDGYLDGTLSPRIVEEFERHLTRCPPCVAYLNTYRRTQDLTRRMGEASMPEGMKAHLRQFLLRRLVQGME